ncbi:MAG TPA: hypothetical protein ENJ02_09550 [Chloroflexi bacterium]|nr:hypothetical protein [Chloroflexota bacterium]
MMPPALLRRASCRGRLALWLTFAALGGLLFSFLPYSVVKPLGDALVPDGSLDLLTPQAFSHIQTLLREGALLWGAALLALWSAGERAEAALCGLRRRREALPARLRADARALLGLLRRRPHPATLWLLAFLTLTAAWLRALWLDAPMQYDEAYTYAAFASRPLRYVVSDYHLPNNHIFHSLLVHFSAALFGVHPWSVRLPVFLTGVLLVPLGYLTARLLYDRPTAILTAALITVSHPLILYAANARGYTLLTAFTLLALSLAALILRRDNLLAWAGLSLVGALGAWTLPVMLYPFSMTLAWLGLGWLLGDAGRPRPRAFLLKLLLCGAGAALGAGALYTPVLLTSGWEALAGNRWVSPLSWPDFWENLPLRLGNTWQEWHAQWPSPLVWLGNAGVAAAMLAGRRVRRFAAPLWGAALLGIFPFLVIQRVAPIPKVWLFFLPIWWMWTAAGMRLLLGKALRLLGVQQSQRRLVPAFLAGAVLLGVAAIPWETGIRSRTTRSPLDEIPQAAAYIQAHRQAGDGVLVPDPLSAPAWFAFAEQGAGREVFVDRNPEGDFSHVWVILNPKQHRPERVLPQAEWPAPALRLPHLDVYRLEAP